MAEKIQEVQGRPLTLHITNIPPEAREDEMLEMFLENATDVYDFSVTEYNDASDEALVSFKNLIIDPKQLIDLIRQKPFLETNLQVNEARVEKHLVVTNIKPNVEKDVIELYFEQRKFLPNGGDVHVEYDSDNHVAIVTYSDPTALDIVLSADCSKMQTFLGPDAILKLGRYFETLDSIAAACRDAEADGDNYQDAIDREEQTTVVSSTINETSAQDESVNQNRDHSRGNRRRGGREGWRARGSSRGRGGSYNEIQTKEIQPLFSSGSGTSDHLPGRRGMPGGNEMHRGSRWPGRGRRSGGDAVWQRNFRGRRPSSGSLRGDLNDEDGSDDERRSDDNASVTSENSESGRGGRPYHQGRGIQRGRGYRAGRTRGGQAQGVLYQRSGSIPCLLDQPLSTPSSSVHKEIEVKNEVKNEKCQLLTTMMYNVRKHGCEAHVDMRRHRFVLNGPQEKVTSAAETVYSQLLSMHSVKLELPARFAQLLVTSRGHQWCIAFFKSAHVRAVYYTDVDGNPMIIAEDEYVAKSAEVQLMRNIRREEIPYETQQKVYLQSSEWSKFVDSAEKNWLLIINVTLSDVIEVVGVKDDVVLAAENIRSQLASIQQSSRSRCGSSSRQNLHSR